MIPHPTCELGFFRRWGQPSLSAPGAKWVSPRGQQTPAQMERRLVVVLINRTPAAWPDARGRMLGARADPGAIDALDELIVQSSHPQWPAARERTLGFGASHRPRHSTFAPVPGLSALQLGAPAPPPRRLRRVLAFWRASRAGDSPAHRPNSRLCAAPATDATQSPRAARPHSPRLGSARGQAYGCGADHRAASRRTPSPKITGNRPPTTADAVCGRCKAFIVCAPNGREPPRRKGAGSVLPIQTPQRLYAATPIAPVFDPGAASWSFWTHCEPACREAL